jgi:hypothetical protein
VDCLVDERSARLVLVSGVGEPCFVDV